MAGQAKPAIAAALRSNGLKLDLVVTVRKPKEVERAIVAFLKPDVDRLIVGGGDGTIGAAATRIAGTSTLLGVIPLGTANDFARTLGIPTAIEPAAAVAAGSHTRAIDLAQANDAFFLNVASIGMSVSAIGALSPSLKRWLGPAAYAVAGARTFLQHPLFVARVGSPGGSSQGRVHQVVVANGRFFGGGVLAAPTGRLDDGLLNVYTLGRISRWRMLRTMAMLKMQVAWVRPGDAYFQTPSLRVETVPPLGVNLDGEVRTTTPVTFRVVPGALRVLTPDVVVPGLGQLPTA